MFPAPSCLPQLPLPNPVVHRGSTTSGYTLLLLSLRLVPEALLVPCLLLEAAGVCRMLLLCLVSLVAVVVTVPSLPAAFAVFVVFAIVVAGVVVVAAVGRRCRRRFRRHC